MNTIQAKVGIFWYYKNKVIGKTYSFSDAERYGDFISPVLGHYDYWEEIQKQLSELYYEEYENIPRGRVAYDLKKDCFVLLSSRKIISSKSAVKAIKVFFSIPENSRLIKKCDFHYEIKEK